MHDVRRARDLRVVRAEGRGHGDAHGVHVALLLDLLHVVALLAVQDRQLLGAAT